jgi:class 3 adenylate cyclase
LESVRGIQQLNRRTALNDEQQLRLKVGLNAGPCIVVTLNNRLDYFGSTVNIAARLSDLAKGDDIWLAQSILDDPATRQIVEENPCDPNEKLQLRGIHKAIEVCRIYP